MDNFTTRTPVRTGSLIVTVFGDCIAARGGEVWLGSLISVLEPLGISHRMVRTAVYRLVQDRILSNEQVGRRSFYSLTPEGRQEFTDATERIYASEPAGWNGLWQIHLTNRVPIALRIPVRRKLEMLGFGSITTDCYAHPNPDQASIDTHLHKFPGSEHIITMRASLPNGIATTELLDLVRDTWSLGSLASSYDEFIDLFTPFLSGASDTLPASDAFYLRTFLIHEYRRVLLRDPGLPADLLPADWPGHEARSLTRTLYAQVVQASEHFVDNHFENEAGSLPAASEQFHSRFGGL